MSGHKECYLDTELKHHNIPSPFISPGEWTREELEKWARETCDHCPIDLGIVRAVRILSESGVETYQSCEGGDEHVSRDAFIDFHGGSESGLHALSICIAYGIEVFALDRHWSVLRGEINGPSWRISLKPTDPQWKHTKACEEEVNE